MPRKITILMTADDVEDEILFTRACLAADPDAGELTAHANAWMGKLDGLRALRRKRSEARVTTDAARNVANNRLDMLCKKFGEQLFLAVAKNRDAGRWKQFFGKHTTGSFIKQALASQVAAVNAWTGITDELFAPHKQAILQWNQAAAAALSATADTATVRGQFAVAEENFAEDLTRERDGLHAALADSGRAKGLPRDWPDGFFRVDTRGRVTNPLEPVTETSSLRS